jgi:hypothetical protein
LPSGIACTTPDCASREPPENPMCATRSLHSLHSIQRTSGPSRSTGTFVPWCSIRFRKFDPR